MKDAYKALTQAFGPNRPKKMTSRNVFQRLGGDFEPKNLSEVYGEESSKATHGRFGMDLEYIT